MTDLSDFKEWFEKHKEEIWNDFATFLSFRSISTDPACAPEIRKTAEWLAAYLKKIGMDAEIWNTPGHPAVFASHLKAGSDRPTLLIYQHYDVQPVDPLDLWHSDPFKATVRNNAVYARGAVDNKGQCFYSLCAVRAFLALCKEMRFNLKFFIEGEEESGGKGTVAILKDRARELKADHLLIVDFDMPEKGVPGLTIGMRGLLAMNVVFRNSKSDLHSGMHGGIALNPLRALTSTLAKLWDEKGKIAIPGFYDKVRPLPKEELKRVHFAFDAQEYEKEFGVKAYATEEGYTPRESNWLRPALEINGLSGGYTGAGFKTVIPAKAEAKISCRLVFDQDPEECAAMIRDFIRAQAPKGIVVDVEILQGGTAFQTSLTTPIVQIAASAFEEVFNQKCRYQLCGASVPIVPALAQAATAGTALLGVGLATDDIHAPNEHFGLDRFAQGFLIMGRILSHLNT